MTHNIAKCLLGIALSATALSLALIGRASEPVVRHEEDGKQLYFKQGCYQCHGLVGQGSIMSGPPLQPLTMTGSRFRAYIRNPAGAMPPYTAKVLSDSDISKIELYVRTFKSKSIDEIPLLARFEATRGQPIGGVKHSPKQTTSSLKSVDLTAGRKLYAQSCSACHGAQLEGLIGPDLRKEALKRDLAGTIQMIMNPPPGMPKLSPTPLSEEQVRQVSHFIRGGH